MRKIIEYAKALWQGDKWLFSLFCIGMLSVLAEIFATIDLFHTTFFATGEFNQSREYIVSQSWAWGPLIVLQYTSLIGIAALLVMILYIAFMLIGKKAIRWKRTIILGTMSFWTFIVWLIFTLLLGLLLELIFPHLFK